MNIGSLYRPVVYPVCKGTAMLNSLIGWDHSTSWYVPYMKQKRRISHSSTGNTVDVNIKASNFQYLSGHVLNDTIVLPEMFYLVNVVFPFFLFYYVDNNYFNYRYGVR